MKFSELITKEIKNDVEILNDFEINKLCYNSKIIEKNDIFFAIKGFKTDGNKYIKDVLMKGAKAVISDSSEIPVNDNIYKVEDCRESMARMSNIFYDFPSEKMKIIGVTGTNGKTTVTSIINFVLEYLKKKTGLIGTNGNIINGEFFETSHTTPESVDLFELLNKMVNAGVEYVTMEVSSHSLELKRVYGIDFDISVFTNLTQEHLDFHNSMDNYFSSKKKLFDSLKRYNKKGNSTSIIYNSDDKYGNKIVDNTEPERISFGFKNAFYSIENLKMDFEGMNFDMLVPLNGEGINKIKIETSLTGKFNVYNILASLAALKQLGTPYSKIQEAVKFFEAVEGRFNQIKLKNGAVAIIDYSHTPDSLYNAIITIKEILGENSKKNKIITVFGCGGNRDKTKRPEMGKIATELSSHVIVTSDNPRDEDPLKIIEDIKEGINSDNYSVEADREKAIEKGIKMSNQNDVILIAGKGHETYQEIKGVKHHLSDKEIARRFA